MGTEKGEIMEYKVIPGVDETLERYDALAEHFVISETYEIPEHNFFGEKVNTLSEAAAIMGIEEKVAAEVITEIKDGGTLFYEAVDFLDESDVKIRFVRTREGAERFKTSIGTPIVRGKETLPKLRVELDQGNNDGWTRVSSTGGLKFSIGEYDGKWYALGDGSWENVVISDASSEQEALIALHKRLDTDGSLRGTGQDDADDEETSSGKTTDADAEAEKEKGKSGGGGSGGGSGGGGKDKKKGGKGGGGGGRGGGKDKNSGAHEAWMDTIGKGKGAKKPNRNNVVGKDKNGNPILGGKGSGKPPANSAARNPIGSMVTFKLYAGNLGLKEFTGKVIKHSPSMGVMVEFKNPAGKTIKCWFRDPRALSKAGAAGGGGGKKKPPPKASGHPTTRATTPKRTSGRTKSVDDDIETKGSANEDAKRARAERQKRIRERMRMRRERERKRKKQVQSSSKSDDPGLTETKDLTPEQIEYKRKFSKAERDKYAKGGQAMKDGSMPILNTEDLKNAIGLVGNHHNPAVAKRHIIKRAHALGCTSKLPDDWNVSK